MSDSKGTVSNLLGADGATKKVALVMVAALAFGVLLIMLCADTAKSASMGLLWSAAFSSVGWFLGFLFGIPRSLSTDTARTVPPTATDNGPTAPEAGTSQTDPNTAPAKNTALARNTVPHGASSTVNTNLEQISDWLTKIIVGVTLVESQAAVARVNDAAALVSLSLGGRPDSTSFALAILVYFSATGLLGSYLLTRLYLQGALANAANPR